jgi:RHS repeat-associated protein
VTWTDALAGTYSLTARATDDKGAVTTSTARTIIVEGTVVSGNVYYIHTDHLDTPREITNEQNQTVWKNPPLTEPFGSTPVDDDPDGDGQAFTFNLRFPGQYYDQETGTHYNYYRDNYLPDFGRYGQSDPIGLAGGINTYAYVNNNPLIFVDPEGKHPAVMCAAVVTVVASAAIISCVVEANKVCEQKYPTHKNLTSPDHAPFWECVTHFTKVCLFGGWANDPITSTIVEIIKQITGTPSDNPPDKARRDSNEQVVRELDELGVFNQ